jgi:poly(A) polymerase
MLNVNLNISPPWSSGIAYEIMMVLGGSDKTMIVGGAVRDWLSGIPVKDIDFASKLLPDESMKILLKAGYNVKPIGIDHGTITVFNNNKSYEITSLRKDIITDGRHARVIFEGSWEDDAYRRDFTINALYSDEYGSIIDPTGLGFKDLESKTLRFIGKPQTRIKEDYIRIIRYFRFFSKYSKNIDKDSMESCIKYAKYLSKISGERILTELEKIFLEKDSKNIINILVDKNIMNALYSPSLVKNFNLEKSLLKKIISLLNTNKNRNSYAFILYTSFIITLQNNNKYNSSKIVLSIVDRFSLSNNDKNLLNRNIAWISKNEIITKKFITKLWLDHGELFVLELKEILSIIDNKKVKIFLSTFNNAPPIFPISGKDLKKIGMSEGKQIGQIINLTRDWWINNDCIPDKNNCISFIKKL